MLLLAGASAMLTRAENGRPPLDHEPNKLEINIIVYSVIAPHIFVVRAGGGRNVVGRLIVVVMFGLRSLSSKHGMSSRCSC